MAATADQVSRLRRMTAEPTATTYSDGDLEDAIERYPIMDRMGYAPYDDDGEVNDDWTPTYDLAAAAAEIWQEKAAAIAGNFDFSADGSSFNRSQAVQNAERQYRLWMSRRAIGTIKLRPEPKPPINLADQETIVYGHLTVTGGTLADGDVINEAED